jgi:hypothetical protein
MRELRLKKLDDNRFDGSIRINNIDANVCHLRKKVYVCEMKIGYKLVVCIIYFYWLIYKYSQIIKR